jgi:hypothetical protein
MTRVKVYAPFVIIVLLLPLLAMQTANCFPLTVNGTITPDYIDENIIVSTVHEFSFTPDNISTNAELSFAATCETSGATFSYLVGTSQAVQEYRVGRLAMVQGKLNVTKCHVDLTIDDVENDMRIYILNDGVASNTINVSYTINNVTFIAGLEFYTFVPTIIYSSAFIGIAVFALWIACVAFERHGKIEVKKHE